MLDGAGAPVKDGLIEVWQANAARASTTTPPTAAPTRLDHGFRGCGRAISDFDTGLLLVRDRQARALCPGRNGHGRWPRI